MWGVPFKILMRFWECTLCVWVFMLDCCIRGGRTSWKKLDLVCQGALSLPVYIFPCDFSSLSLSCFLTLLLSDGLWVCLSGLNVLWQGYTTWGSLEIHACCSQWQTKKEKKKRQNKSLNRATNKLHRKAFLFVMKPVYESVFILHLDQDTLESWNWTLPVKWRLKDAQ